MTGAAFTAAPASYEPLVSVRAGDLVADLRTYCVSATREAFRLLPLRYVFTAALDAPVLRFPSHSIGRAAVLLSLIAEQRQRYANTADPQKRISIATRARRFHLMRVSLACGYSWPGNDARVVVEFAP